MYGDGAARLAAKRRAPGGTMHLVRIMALLALSPMASGCSRWMDAPRVATVSPMPATATDGRYPVDEQRPRPPRPRTEAAGVNPYDVLASSRRSRIAWEPLHPNRALHPTDAPRPSSVAGIPVATGPETATTGSTTPAPAKVPSGGKDMPERYDRYGALDKLQEGGRRTGNSVCSGC